MRPAVRLARYASGVALGLLLASGGIAETVTLPGASPFDSALAKRLAAAAASRSVDEVRTRHRNDDGSPRFTNRLVLEQSPYLLQHAHNPVNWHPWGDEAFETARRLGRPVLVSIGYSTCHWCHVMEDESFDDLETAKLLNESFVAIKVDREVRPDVDATYMAAIHALGRRGGWPLNVFLTPDRKPFHAGTYFPPEDRSGMPGFPRVLTALRDLYAQQPEEVVREAQRVTDALRAALVPVSLASAELPPRALLARATQGLASRYDPEWGGLQSRTKFPGALPIPLLLRVHRSDGDAHALEMATHSLQQMARSGLRDHVGGGFHRYTTDPRWQTPHFEKMLYDNARLVLAYLEAWQATGRADFAEVARDTALAIQRDFEAPEGGFYSASDADSPGPDGESVEGLYFTWTRDELEALLGPEDGALAGVWYDVGVEPLLEGRSVLRTPRRLDELALERETSEAGLRDRLAAIRAKLARARASRAAPLVDRKLLTSWNGLAISALARAGFALREPALVASAARAARAFLAVRDDAGRLRRVRYEGETSGVAFLEDYAFAIASLLDLYEAEAEADPDWLAAAIALQQRLDADFADPEGGGYFRSGAGDETMLVRDKPVIDDGTLPSSNGTAALNLLRLGALTSDDTYVARADRVFSAFRELVVGGPTRAPTLLIALDWRHDIAQEVILVLPEQGGDAEPLLEVLRRVHQPHRVLAVVREGAHLKANAEWVSLVSGKRARRGSPTAYVCENRTCRFPTDDPAEFERQLLRRAAADGVTP
jgi:uncharacterized protein YyaL (SSP411 family)